MSRRILPLLLAVLILSPVVGHNTKHLSKQISNGKYFVIETNHGNITLELFEDKAPITVANFRRYANSGFYEGTIFHRVIPNFAIQGGGMLADGFKDKEATYPPIKNEANDVLKNLRGTVSVARKVDPDSGTCQFFINVRDNAYLDRGAAVNQQGYCVFGHVVKGMDIVDKITAVKTGQRGVLSDVPVENIVIKSVKSVENVVPDPIQRVEPVKQK